MRTVVVLDEDGELAVALRERLDRAWVTVVDAAEDFSRVVASCEPWPWMIVGSGGVAPHDACDLACRRPVLVRWLGTVPPRMPRHAHELMRFSDLATSISNALAGDVGGVRLAIGTGVAVAGEVHANAELEALLGEAPGALDFPPSRFRSADALLRRRAPHVRLASTPHGVRLEAA